VQHGLEAVLRRARRAIVLGMGGGGDVVGALATARLCERLGVETVLGGVAWERMPIDPHPGPRSTDEIVDATALAQHVVLAGPATRAPSEAPFAEARMAEFLGRETVLVDVLAPPAAIAEGLHHAAAKLEADLVVYVDVGGDVLARGREPGLASPLCDAVMLAAAVHLERLGTPVLGAVFGPGCDGELTAEELIAQLASLAAAGALVAAIGIRADVAAELARAVELVPTEASAQAIRCAAGEIGQTTIRRGRRTVSLSALGAVTFYFHPTLAVEHVAPLARAVIDARGLEHANDILHGLGVRTELDFERSIGEA
jgi:hypothetical protein